MNNVTLTNIRRKFRSFFSVAAIYSLSSQRLVLFSVYVFEASFVEDLDKVTIVQETNFKEWKLVVQEITVLCSSSSANQMTV